MEPHEVGLSRAVVAVRAAPGLPWSSGILDLPRGLAERMPVVLK